MTTRKFLRFTYAAIKRYGDKNWTAHTGVVEFNPTYTVSCSECEKGFFGIGKDLPFIVELSNGTGAEDEILSEKGEVANSYVADECHAKVKQNINKLNTY